MIPTRLTSRLACGLVLGLCLLGQLPRTSNRSAAAPRHLPAAAKRAIDFQRDVQPIFAAHCVGCHGPERQESNYRIDVRLIALRGGDFQEQPILPGKSAESPLIQYVSGLDPAITMPPEGERLSAGEIAILRAWIDQGADWPDALAGSATLTTDHWSFQPIEKVIPPKAFSPDWAENEIDRFILAKLDEAGLKPSPPADRRTLIRRLYLDMLGLLPSIEEVERFVHDDRPDAYRRLVEHVLASPHYGERWGRHWLDVVRFAETDGFEMNQERPNAWRYRDWVIQAFNEDKPYDQFVFEQLAGDAVEADVATGFLVGGPYDKVKSPDITLTLMQRQDELADMLNTTGTAFLGLTLGCARCHNHKFDPILQKDYYAFQAVFAGVQHGDRTIRTPEYEQRRQQLAEIEEEINDVHQQLVRFQPASTEYGTFLLDDEAGDASPPHEQSPTVTLLQPQAGHGSNPDGTQRGYRHDPGDFHRLPNLSRGRYRWWKNQPATDVFSWNPAAEGHYRIWLSWGCGFDTHTRDAQYVLDLDGDLQTEDDQRTIAIVDQQHFAPRDQPSIPQASAESNHDEAASPPDRRPESAREPQALPSQPLWSGFFDAGVHRLQPNSRIILRGGQTGSAMTADVLAFEEISDQSHPQRSPLQPRLQSAVNAKRNEERFTPRVARWIRFTVLATNDGSEPCLDELEIWSTDSDDSEPRNVALAETGATASSSGDYAGNSKHKLEHIHDGRYGNDRSWISQERGQGWVQIQLAEPAVIDRIVWGRDREEKYTDRLPTYYRIEVAAEPDRWQVVATSEDRMPQGTPEGQWLAYDFSEASPEQARQGRGLLARLKSLHDRKEALSAIPVKKAYAGQFTQPKPTHRLYRGDPMLKREVVAPAALTVLDEDLGLTPQTPEQQRRIALARWITADDHPLTARVMVNRIWHYHFGTGLVDTPSDFGANGSPPTHPQLLDWLAREFLESGWSMKHIHRMILLSSTYRQSSLPNADSLAIDSDSRLLWRFPPRRLEAEVIRDVVLQVSGGLDRKMRGPGFSVFQPNSNYVRVYEPKEEFGPAEWRRMVYMTKVRMEKPPTFGAFDCPDAGQVAPKRPRSTTAIQALNLFNSEFMIQQAELFARRLQEEAGPHSSRQVRRAFRLTLGREPDSQEMTAAEQLVESHGLTALCRAILNASELLFLP